MIRDISFSVAFGIASTLFLSLSLLGAGGQATSGNAFQTMSLMTLSVVPLFLSGLGWGLMNASISVVTGAVIAGLFVDPMFSLTYVVTCGLPVLAIIRQALLWREDDNKIIWYPASGLMVCWVLVCIALSCMAAFLLYMNDELRADLIRQFDLIVSHIQKQGAMFAEITAEELVWLMPRFFGPFWGILLLASGCLAQGLLVRFKKNLRPSPEFSGFAMPKWSALAAIVSIGASLAIGQSGPVIGAIVVTLEIAFFLQGMAVIHTVSKNWSYRSLVLTAVYLIMILMFWPAMVIALLGLVDSWLNFRSRLQAAPDQEEN